MTDTMTHLTTRVPGQLIEALDDLARERRMQTGENVRRADLVREALEAMAKGGGASRGVDHDDDPHDFGAIVLDALEELANEAERQGIEDDAQALGMAIWPTATKDQRVERLLAFASKLHGALRAV